MSDETFPSNGYAGMSSWREYAVRYDAPAEYAGLVTNIRGGREIAERLARTENAHPGGAFKCVVVSRTVSCTPWETDPE